MADDHDGLQLGIFFQHAAKIGKRRARAQGIFHLQLTLETQFVAHERRGLRRALQRAGDHCVDLDIESGERAADKAALLDAFFIEGALFIFFGTDKAFAGAGVPQEI